MTNPKDNSGNNVSRILNIIFCLLFLAVTVAMALKPTNLVPQVILFYSVKKFLIILVLAGLTLYFGISAFYRKISEINVLMIFGIVVSLLFGEMVLSFFPSLIPIKYHFLEL